MTLFGYSLSRTMTGADSAKGPVARPVITAQPVRDAGPGATVNSAGLRVECGLFQPSAAYRFR